MALIPRLELRQSQTLVMTPQLQQAIKLLQLSNLELCNYVEHELEQNPLLERADADDADDAPAVADGAAEAGTDEQQETASSDDVAPDLDTEYDNLWNSDGASDLGSMPSHDSRRAASGSADSSAFLEQAAAGEIGLRDHLLNQLNMDHLHPVDRVIGVYLIDLLDDAGYIGDDLTPMARQLGCDVARVEATLHKVQRYDPPGIFARSLKECLALQLRERNRLDPAMQTMLENLDLLADQEDKELQRRCGVDAEDFAEMLTEIKALNPKPGLAFDNEVTQTIVPDVFVRRGPDGDWLLELNNDTLPRVLVDQRYYAKVSRQAKTKKERQYLSDRLNSANWLVKSLDQRANTILRVGSELVRQQNGFFVNGVQHLRPLIMRDVADAIEMHESTVSRVTANKYMSTPRGMFEMRYFFTNAIASTRGGGEAHSSEAVRQRIKSLIADEDPKATLSDDRMVTLLKDHGIDIARRTVAKYREMLRIPSSLDRRRQKKRRK